MNASSARLTETRYASVQPVLIVAALLIVEVLLASMIFDGGDISAAHGSFLPQAIAFAAPWVLRGLIVFVALVATILYVRAEWRAPVVQTRSRPSLLYASAHIASAAAVLTLSTYLYGQGSSGPWKEAIAAAWITSVLATASSAVLVFLSLRAVADLVWPLRGLLLGSAVAAVFACAAGHLARTLWEPTRYLTFQVVGSLLSLFVNDVVSIPDRFEIGTSRFTVLVAAECSGLEGLGLLMVFGLLWWILFGRTLGLGRSVMLFAIAAVTLYVLNAARIVALLLIGHAGAHAIALGGFHSQAGWISFATVAFGLTLAGRRLSDRRDKVVSSRTETDNPAAPFLMPFLAFIAAGMVSTAFSAGFEWLYGLRVGAVIVALWYFRRAYKTIVWRVTWYAPIVGVVVFVLWIGLEWLLRGSVRGTSIPAQSTAADATVQTLWLVLRIAGATILVPIAEELAFRSYLLRRFVAADFESAPAMRWTVWAVFASSVLFGLLHGERWFAGTVAGAFYAWAVVRRGSIGDAVVAHSVTNALLAIFVLYFSAWHLW